MARPRKVYQTPVIEPVAEPVVEKPVETVEKKVQPTLVPKDGSVAARRAPTMEPKRIAYNLSAGYTYKIQKEVHSAIYGDFYLLENGLYVAKVGNFVIK